MMAVALFLILILKVDINQSIKLLNNGYSLQIGIKNKSFSFLF
jgi:hypothetical protein